MLVASLGHAYNKDWEEAICLSQQGVFEACSWFARYSYFMAIIGIRRKHMPMYLVPRWSKCIKASFKMTQAILGHSILFLALVVS
jgi:hypothetical protein